MPGSKLNACSLGLAERFSSLIDGLAYLLLGPIDQSRDLLTRLFHLRIG
jgi:hypothetical protein